MSTQGFAIHAEIDLAFCSGEVCINGIPVVTWQHESLDSFVQSIQVNPFVVPGLNTFELAIHIDKTSPSLSRRARQYTPNPAAVAIGRLVRYRLEPFLELKPQNGEVLANLTWSAQRDGTFGAPQELRVVVDLGAGFGKRAWQDAPQLTVDDATRQEAIMLMEEIRAALRRGDVHGLMRLIDIKVREGAASYPGLDVSKMAAQFGQWIQQFAKEPERVLPLDLQNIDLRLAAERRIIVPMTSKWHGAIGLRLPMTNESDEWVRDIDSSYDVMFARIDGRLRVVA